MKTHKPTCSPSNMIPSREPPSLIIPTHGQKKPIYRAKMAMKRPVNPTADTPTWLATAAPLEEEAPAEPVELEDPEVLVAEPEAAAEFY